MFEIKTTDEEIMQQYLRKQGIKNEFRYLFTFDENYIFMVKENKSINTYCAICVTKYKTMFRATLLKGLINSKVHF